MTAIKQQAYELIRQMSDEKVVFIVNLLRTMSQDGVSVSVKKSPAKKQIKRTGRSAGMLPMPAGFDNYFDEDNEMIASLFEGAG